MKVDNISSQGIGAWKISGGHSRYEFVYMGKDEFSKDLNIHIKQPIGLLKLIIKGNRGEIKWL